uniref:hypothetical protein n=1 Tax=Paraisaria gracilioides TaxID=2651847 RepID=UPI0023D7B939|nr:hypothetical protein P2Y88_mgp05 [Paraisaria gracilioides]WDE74403.1 hypothetical protein [Paraisaria gracilioides]
MFPSIWWFLAEGSLLHIGCTYNLIILCLIIQNISLPFRVYTLTEKTFTIPQFVQNKTFTRLV